MLEPLSVDFAFSTVAYYCKRWNSSFLRYAYDINPEKSRSLCDSYGGLIATNEIEAIGDDPRVKIVFICSNHSSHQEYASYFLSKGKHVHIEKPHVVNESQLRQLTASMVHEGNDRSVFLGFNRPRSPLFKILREYLDSETGPVTINWFVAGHEIPDDHWYFSPKEGGRVLGNLCHWTDLSVQIVGLENSFPCKVVPLPAENAKSDFGVMILFADDSLAVISFSAKGHTFDGVRETLNFHRGNKLGTLQDFRQLVVNDGPVTHKHRLWFRDHGHGDNIFNSLSSLEGGGGESPFQIESSAQLFLAVKKAIDSGRAVTCLGSDH